MEVPDFEGCIQLDAFLDWVEQVDQYFKWKEILEDKNVKFISLRLKGQVLVWWNRSRQLGCQRGNIRLGRGSI